MDDLFDALGRRVVKNLYDEDHRLIAQEDSNGQRTEFNHDIAGRLSVVTDRRRTEYTYDAYGRLTETRYPDGSRDSKTYDQEGNLKTETDRLNRTTGFTYDKLNRLIKTTYPDGTFTQTEYDVAGRVIRETDARGHVTTYEYDAAGRRTLTRDALGNEHQFAYDQNGNLIEETDAHGHSTTYVYNQLDQKEATIFHDQTKVQNLFDALGRKTHSTDQNQQPTEYAYDALGRLTEVRQFLNGDTLTTSYSYDSQSNKLTQTDAEGRTTSWTYDSLGRVTSRTLPIGQVETFTYDANGNLQTHTDFNGDTTAHEYDVMNRLIRTLYADGSEETFTYTDTGQRASSTQVDSAGNARTTTYTYDLRDRLLQQTNPDGSTVAYEYDAAGNTTKVTETHNGETTVVSHSYDALNRLQSTTDGQGTTRYSYDAVGNLIQETRSTGLTVYQTYDSLNRLLEERHENAQGDLLKHYQYTLDQAGYRTALDEGNGTIHTYSYDDLYRLTHEQITDPQNGHYSAVYEYNKVGNPTSTTINGTAIAYSHDANDRLLQKGNTIYTYDANGNTLSESDGGTTIHYRYNHKNELVEQQKQGSSTSYGYDVDGLRTEQIHIDGSGNRTHTRYVLDKNRPYAQVIAEMVNGATEATYTYGHDLISQQRAEGTSYYHYDGLGSTRFLTDEAGTITDQYHYEAFGTLRARSGNTENHYLFAGEQFDSNLNQYYLRARYYDANRPGFTTMDSYPGRMAEPATLHKYAYTHNNPVNGIDPSGNVSLAATQVGLNGTSNLVTSAVSQNAKKYDLKLTGDRSSKQTEDLYLLGSASPGVQKVILLLSNKAEAINQIKYNPEKGTTLGLSKLSGLAPEFKPLAKKVLNELNAKGYNLRIIWGKRTKEENDDLVKKGHASPTSKHLEGVAMDFINRVVGYNNKSYPIYTAATAVAAKNAGVVWGGNFKSRWDPNHIEQR